MTPPRRNDYFFYGTLMDDNVLARVVGAAARALAAEPAWIDDYERLFVAGATYPVLVPQRGGRVEGKLVRGLDARQAGRVARYEADFYDLREVAVSTTGGLAAKALTFLPRDGIRPSCRVWRLDDWRRRHKRRFLRRIGRWIED